VYVCGGITPRLLERVKAGGLRSAFLHKGSRFAPFLETIPVDLVTDGAVGMLGSREYARTVEDEL
jgi:glucokinase